MCGEEGTPGHGGCHKKVVFMKLKFFACSRWSRMAVFMVSRNAIAWTQRMGMENGEVGGWQDQSNELVVVHLDGSEDKKAWTRA